MMGRLAPTVWVIGLTVLVPKASFGMHVADGVLSLPWAGLWWALALPFLALGLRQLRTPATAASGRATVGLIGAAVFVVSSAPIPVPLVGTTVHACGTGLAAILIGPGLTVVVTSVVLVLQALLLGEGGLSAIGANVVSMGVAGAYVGFAAFRFARRLGLPVLWGVFLAGLLSNWATYAVTSFQLAGVLRGDGPFGSTLAVVLLAFAPTEVPMGIVEGLLSAGAYRFVLLRRPRLLGPFTGSAQ